MQAFWRSYGTVVLGTTCGGGLEEVWRNDREGAEELCRRCTKMLSCRADFVSSIPELWQYCKKNKQRK